MGIEFKSIIPWGRSYEEYSSMFRLNEADYAKKIIGCGDGPASFNKHMKEMGDFVVSCDPIYEYSKDMIKQRINDVKYDVLKQLQENLDNYVWDKFKNPEELLSYRLNIMNDFLEDYEDLLSQN